MNKTKISNPVRLIAFFLTAFLLVCTFGLSADGWQTDEGQKDENITQNPNASDDNSSINDTSDIPEIYIPKFINRLTGIETDEADAQIPHYAFIMNGDSPLYGIWESDILCELPTEDGRRYIAFISEGQNLWKCGIIKPARGYISNVVKYFGGICVSYGNDDAVSYNKCDINEMNIDLSVSDKYYYTEFGSNVYCNTDLMNFAASNSNIKYEDKPLPFEFVDFGKDPLIYGDHNAEHIRVERSLSNFSDIHYNNESQKYTVSNNGAAITDAINGKVLEFTNCFILFADSVTYDNANGYQMVMDTIGCGVGYYFSMGGITKIMWSADDSGVMSFTLEDGSVLVANRGRSYIAFLKTSMLDRISYE